MCQLWKRLSLQSRHGTCCRFGATCLTLAMITPLSGMAALQRRDLRGQQWHAAGML